MRTLSFGTMSSLHLLLLQMMSIVLLSVVVCHPNDNDRQHTDFLADAETSPHRKRNEMKRPFGSGAFARGKSPEVRGSGQRSLTPWPMSKYVQVDENKRSRDKRPFGPGAFSRPSSQRVGKRPFGGGVIFSRPRDEGNAKLNYGRYGYSRQRREQGFEDSPSNAAFRDGRHGGRSFREAILDDDDYANAWMKTVEDLPLGRSEDEYDVEYYDKEDPRGDGRDALETEREIKKQNIPGTLIDDKRMAG